MDSKEREQIIKAINEFEDFLVAELGAVKLGEIALNDRKNLLQTHNIHRHFNVLKRECGVK